MNQALTFASIVLGVSVAFELENLNRLIRHKGVRWHWAQPLFALFVLLLIMFYWWSIADRPEGRISLGAFLPIMWSLVTLALLSAAALPDKLENGIDLAEYYQRNRFYLWGLVILTGLPIEIRWLYTVATNSSDIVSFFLRAGGDLVAFAAMIAMMFVRRWWLVALGFAINAIGPIAWLSRTI
ncbi:hypothetical protein [Stakelama tenebrarum]|uniref:Uncharacterized protein n=1 Tax=Stakelama tenebrarum TaxID=2711215 RepID=A0A6G6Y3G0_9SPHN|nr:hypothetical protein [Sphingosinithalassobacter tenebrarum]QIG79258.1 hypothetical protein G5C33_05255 [Sphingosinithalassobacter tenebrarum]